MFAIAIWFETEICIWRIFIWYSENVDNSRSFHDKRKAIVLSEIPTIILHFLFHGFLSS